MLNSSIMKINICEIFRSLQGETLRAGLPSLFIRLSGCNLNCAYCDTPQAKKDGRPEEIGAIIKIADEQKDIDHITITGGEPLLQPNSVILMQKLLAAGHPIQIETNGSLSVKDVPRGVRKIIDVKTPSSGENGSFLRGNIEHIDVNDEIKFVISDIEDYNYSRDFTRGPLNGLRATINFSPVYGRIPYKMIAEKILADRLRVRLNIQLHKIIWPEGEPQPPLA
jgi:7-carboxy-7-deazaguanine synthase